MNTSVVDILETARQHRVSFRLVGDKLEMAAPYRPPDDFIKYISMNKAAVVCWLSKAPKSPKPNDRQVLSFAIDGYDRYITAIDMASNTQTEAVERLLSSWTGRIRTVLDGTGRLVWTRGDS